MFLCFGLMFFIGTREGHSLMDNVFAEFADAIFTSKGHLFLVLYVFDQTIIAVCYSGGW